MLHRVANRIPEYQEAAKAAYGEPLSEENIGKAIASFMRTLITPNYPLGHGVVCR